MPGPSDYGSQSGGAGDMFLSVKGARGGVIKGESQDDAHKGEIEVLGWSWGMHARPTISAGGGSGKAAVHELKITKNVDSASTALMASLRTNELIVKAVLTLRKSGKGHLEYFKVTIEQGRVTSLTIDAGDPSGGSKLIEVVTFSFNKITVEYVPQGKDGQGLGAMSYNDEWKENS